MATNGQTPTSTGFGDPTLHPSTLSQWPRWSLAHSTLAEYPSRVRNAASGIINHVLYGKWRQRPARFLRIVSSERPDSVGKNSIIWLLGRSYLLEENDRNAELDFVVDVRSRIWLTYRQDFPPLLNSQKVSDCGWGCMLRCGQMMIAQALVLRQLSRDWRLGASYVNAEVEPIIRLFEDCERATLSIHNLIKAAAQQRAKTCRSERDAETSNDEFILPISRKSRESAVIGQRFSPSEVMALLHDVIHASSNVPSLKLCSSKDMNVIAEDLVKLSENWTNAVFLTVPVRLGTQHINKMYYNQLKSLFSIEQCCGVIGGRPKRAFYFIGCEHDRLYYLDPHTVHKYQPLDGKLTENDVESSSSEPIVDLELMDECLRETGIDLTAATVSNGRGRPFKDTEEQENRKWMTFHCTKTPSLPLADVDPSLAIGFLFRNQRDLDLCMKELILANVIDYKDGGDTPQNFSAAQSPIFTVYKSERCFAVANYGPAVLSRSWDGVEQRIINEQGFEII